MQGEKDKAEEQGGRSARAALPGSWEAPEAVLWQRLRWLDLLTPQVEVLQQQGELGLIISGNC